MGLRPHVLETDEGLPALRRDEHQVPLGVPGVLPGHRGPVPGPGLRVRMLERTQSLPLALPSADQARHPLRRSPLRPHAAQLLGRHSCGRPGVGERAAPARHRRRDVAAGQRQQEHLRDVAAAFRRRDQGHEGVGVALRRLLAPPLYAGGVAAAVARGRSRQPEHDRHPREPGHAAQAFPRQALLLDRVRLSDCGVPSLHGPARQPDHPGEVPAACLRLCRAIQAGQAADVVRP